MPRTYGTDVDDVSSNVVLDVLEGVLLIIHLMDTGVYIFLFDPLPQGQKRLKISSAARTPSL